MPILSLNINVGNNLLQLLKHLKEGTQIGIQMQNNPGNFTGSAGRSSIIAKDA